MQGELSFGVLQELQNHCDHPKPILPPVPQDKQEVEPAFDLLKSMVAEGRTALGNLAPPPPLAQVAHDAVVLGKALEKFIGEGYNTELPPTVALEDITEAGCMIYLVQLRCQPFRDCCHLHFVRTVQAFQVIAAFLKRLARHGHGAQKFFACVCGNKRAEDGFCLVWTILIDRSCTVVGCTRCSHNLQLPPHLVAEADPLFFH